MIPFRRYTLFFFIILLGLNLWIIFDGRSSPGSIYNHADLIYGLLFTVYAVISFVLAFLPCTNFHHPVICRGKKDSGSVSLTFDDGPDPVKTPAILEILRKYDVKATFFCIGRKLTGNEIILKQMNDEGHLVGNHSMTHSVWSGFFSSGRIRSELLATDQLIKNITGKTPLFFRPPFGVLNPMIHSALKNMHWATICWSVRSLDTRNTDPQKIKTRIIRHLHPGAIILLHDHTPFSGNNLDELLAAIRNAGYAIVPLDKLLKLPAYAS